MLLHNYWPDTIPDSKRLPQAVLVGVQRAGAAYVDVKVFLMQTARVENAVPRETLSIHSRGSVSFFFLFIGTERNVRIKSRGEPRLLELSQECSNFLRNRLTNKASEKGSTVMNALCIPKVTNTVPSILIKNWYYLLDSL